MLDCKPWMSYTIIRTNDIKSVMNDYPHSKIELLEDKDTTGWMTVAIVERSY